METIKVKIGLVQCELNTSEVERIVKDHDFMRDAILMLLRPDLCEKSSDFQFSKADYLQYLKEMFLENRGGYSEEFINKVFDKCS